MKPTPQISHNRNSRFPLTDYNFQATGDPKTGCSSVYPGEKSLPFHRLSSEFFGEEESRHYVVEFSSFTVLGLITAWPIMAMLIAVTRLVYYITNALVEALAAASDSAYLSFRPKWRNGAS